MFFIFLCLYYLFLFIHFSSESSKTLAIFIDHYFLMININYNRIVWQILKYVYYIVFVCVAVIQLSLQTQIKSY